MTKEQIIANIPDDLKRLKRWIPWKNLGGKKVPIIQINTPEKWLTFDEVISRYPVSKMGGIGFVFGQDSGAEGIGGIDLDACIDPATGELTEWAAGIMGSFDSYTEISPSGTGIKIFAKGAPEKISPNVVSMGGEYIGGKQPQVEVYCENRYFAVTGNVWPGFEGKGLSEYPLEWEKLGKLIGSRVSTRPAKSDPPTPLEKIRERASPAGGRNNALTSLAGALRKRGLEQDAILAALRAHNLKTYNPPLPEQEIVTIVTSVCKYEKGVDDFLTDKNGNILPNKQDNIRLALTKLKVSLRYNTFADKVTIRYEDNPETILDDKELDDLWFLIDTTFHFRPVADFFGKWIPAEARKTPFHPVIDYLAALQWDHKERISNWLTTYAQAAENEYTRAVGRLTLIAAVKRVRFPGCKFDEMLILESSQGKDKSTFLATLAGEETWFTDDLPLTSDSKEVIERTSGKWIIEAADLSGMKQSDTEALKAFLSRRIEVARLAYGRLTTERPRHFIIVGTTNSQYYLKDSTGNRRFWPVRVEHFDTAAIKRDRDQLWAEAAYYESQGESIRLDPKLYGVAGIQQERRRVDDPWEQAIQDILPNEMAGSIPCADIWEIVGVKIDRRTPHENQRVGEAMRKLGWERKKVNHGGIVFNAYQRGSLDERQGNRIRVRYGEDGLTAEVVNVHITKNQHNII